jgi:hypothetical protein
MTEASLVSHAPQATRSRRSLLAAAAAGAAGAAVASLGVVAPVAAADSGQFTLGASNDATLVTQLTTTSSVNTGLAVTTTGSGVAILADSTTGVGVDSVGRIGVYAHGNAAGPAPFTVYGLYARVDSVGNGPAVVAEHAISGAVPANTAIFANVSSKAHHGIQAYGGLSLPDRSGKAKIVAGKTYLPITVPGITSANFAIATLATNKSGVYVRAVVCATNKITVYLNTHSSTVTYVSWLVLG